MTFKINFILIIATGYLLMLCSCSSSQREQKQDDAFDRVKKVRMLSNDSSFVSDEVIQESMKTELAPIIETPDMWTTYTNELEKKIRKNENKIKEIKALSKENKSLLRKLNSLENDNNNLRFELAKYIEEAKLNWEMFKTSMNHHVNEINIELKTLKP
ncbi:MAG: hypothetical protein ACERKD_10000 [Prolixibacteraceae bacterium]